MPPRYHLSSSSTPQHSDDIQDIIATVPTWIMRWGITVFFALIILIISLAALIEYPDVIKTKLIVTSQDEPKKVVAKVTGKLAYLLVRNNQKVKDGMPLAFIECRANHHQVMALLTQLKIAQRNLSNLQALNSLILTLADNSELGELQPSYQSFLKLYTSYYRLLTKVSSLKKQDYFLKDMTALRRQYLKQNAKQILKQRNYNIAKGEFKSHQKLKMQELETSSRLWEQKSKFLLRKDSSLRNQEFLTTANKRFIKKQREITRFNSQFLEKNAEFVQALNSFISEIEDWRSKYVLLASQNGNISFAGIIQKNQVLIEGQDVFYISSGNKEFFGKMDIPQDNFGRVHEGQQVLIKLKSYPFEQYGMLKGKITYLADVAYKDSVFVSKVDFDNHLSYVTDTIILRNGMVGDAEIITQNATILRRLTRTFVKSINSY